MCRRYDLGHADLDTKLKPRSCGSNELRKGKIGFVSDVFGKSFDIY